MTVVTRYPMGIISQAPWVSSCSPDLGQAQLGALTDLQGV